MKIDIDTLIYIIVMIVFIVLGAIGKKKKPVQQAVPSPEAENEEEEFNSPEDILAEKLKAFIGDYHQREDLQAVPEENIFNREERIPEKTIIEKEQQRVEAYKTDLPETENPIDMVHAIHDEIQEGIHVFKEYKYDDHSELISGDLTKSENQPDTDAYHLSVLSEIYEEFNLTKAIIFSEILVRKQF